MVDRLETKVPPVVWTLIAIGLVFAAGAVVNERWIPEDRRTNFAILAAMLGLLVALAALGRFGRAETSVDPHSIDKASTLVTSGVYRFTRNPMYLGLCCFVVAAGVWRGSVIATAVAVTAFVGVMNRLQIIPEERYLAKRFGTPYRTFRSSVRRWL